MFIYTLKLVNDKYYIGKTENMNVRVPSHFNGYGSVWTSKYPCLELVESFETTNPYDEDSTTLKYMEKYGIDNVRGGQWCQIVLSSEQRNQINSSFTAGQDKCYKCNLPGHFARNCPNPTNESFVDIESEDTNDTNDKEQIRAERVETVMKRCYNAFSEGLSKSIMTWLYTDNDEEDVVRHRLFKYKANMLISYSGGILTGMGGFILLGYLIIDDDDLFNADYCQRNCGQFYG